MRIIAGTHRNQKISTPAGQHTRPTASRLRETLFNITQSYVDECEFLDLFAGSGAMGLEALSRGAKHCLFIDNSKEAIKCIEQNLLNFKLKEQGRTLFGEVFKMLERLIHENRKFDIIYADAPYSKSFSSSCKLIEVIDQSPLLNEDGMLFIEDVDSSIPNLTLQTLELVSERRSGPAYLHQYRKTMD